MNIKLSTSFFLFLSIFGTNTFNLTATMNTNYVVNANSNLDIEILIDKQDVSINIYYLCNNCIIDFLFFDNDDYLKYSNGQSYIEKVVVKDRETYTNRIFIPTRGTWWVVFENKDSTNKSLDFSYEEVDPPVTENWIFWIALIPWLIGFFGITGYWFYRKRSKQQNK
jgi:hypothetical protein